MSVTSCRCRPSPRDVVRRGNGGDAKLRRRNHEAFVHKNLGSSRMIDRHQRQIIVVVDLPELRSDAQVIVAVVRHELIASDLVPLSRGRDLRGAERIDAQADRGSPGNGVLHKLHLFAVEGEQKRTRAFNRCSVTTSWSAFTPNSARTVPFGQMTRTTSALVCSPKPK